MQIRYKPIENVELKRGSAQYNMPTFGGQRKHPDYMIRKLIDKKDPGEKKIFKLYRPTPGVFTDTITFEGTTSAAVFHMPSSIAMKFGAKWGEENIPPTFEERGGAGSVVKEEGRDVGRKVKGGVSGAVGGRSHKAEMAKSGKAYNPYKEYIFEEMQFRQFQFQFTISPTNAQIEKDTLEYIRTLTADMHPSLEDGGVSKYLNAPGTFKIILSNGSYLVEPKDCALSNFEVTYNGDGPWATFKHSGNPILYKLSFTFQEVNMLTKEDL